MTLLKKRLFSSPAAFVRTLEVHRETLLRDRRAAPAPPPNVLQRLFDDAANAHDEEASDDGVGEAAREAIEAAATAEQQPPDRRGAALLDRMTPGPPSRRHRGRPHEHAAGLGRASVNPAAGSATSA